MGVDGGWEKSFVEDQCGCVGVGFRVVLCRNGW